MCEDIKKILLKIVKSGFLEDRLEDDAKMLAHMYSLTLTSAEAEELYHVIQKYMRKRDVRGEA